MYITGCVSFWKIILSSIRQWLVKSTSEGSVFINVLLSFDLCLFISRWFVQHCTYGDRESKEIYLKVEFKVRDECVNVAVFASYFSSRACSDNAGSRKTIKPKIIIINLNPRILPSKAMIMCHNCLYLYYIKMCKGLLSKTEFMLLAVKLENVSQDRICTSLSVWLFISCFCF